MISSATPSPRTPLSALWDLPDPEISRILFHDIFHVPEGANPHARKLSWCQYRHLLFQARLKWLNAYRNAPGIDFNRCPSAPIVADLLELNLAPAPRRVFLNHVRECSSCSELYRALYTLLSPWHPIAPPTIPNDTPGGIWLRGAGISLWPLFSSKELVSLRAISGSQLGRGHILAYAARDSVIAHRVLSTRRYGGSLWFYLCGANVSRPDGWVPEYRVLGSIAPIKESGRWPRIRFQMLLIPTFVYLLFVRAIFYAAFESPVSRIAGKIERRFFLRRGSGLRRRFLNLTVPRKNSKTDL